METCTVAYEAELAAGVWTNISVDVLSIPHPRFDYGIHSGNGPLDLVADTGILNLVLDNGQRNSANLAGYYTPGHANCRVGWDEGTGIRIKITYGGADYYKWRGRVASITVEPGLYQERTAVVMATDWMDLAASQQIAQLAIQSSKRVDEVLASIIANMPIAPRATSFATGAETLDTVFNTDVDERMSPMSMFQKLMLNELGGFIYLKGDLVGGETLRFDSRHTRLLNKTSILTLDDEMQDCAIEYDRRNVYNKVKVRYYPLEVDASPTTELYSLKTKPYIVAGQSMTLTLQYRDPATGKRISASDVVTPLVADTDYKFGSSSGTANDLNASLGQVNAVGGNTIKVIMTNNAGVTGYLNMLKVRGKGIYSYDPATVEAENAPSMAARGELTLQVELRQHASDLQPQAYAQWLVGLSNAPTKRLVSVRYLANTSAARMTAALTGEPSSRFTVQEAMNAISGDYFVNGISFEIGENNHLTVEWTGPPAVEQAGGQPAQYDVSLYDAGDYYVL